MIMESNQQVSHVERIVQISSDRPLQNELM